MQGIITVKNPSSSKIKSRGVLRKSSIHPSTIHPLKKSINQVLQRCPCRNSALAEEVLRGIEVNAQLNNYLETLEEEIQQITKQIFQIERTYRFAEEMGQECESIEASQLVQERDNKTMLLLSRLNQILSVSRSYGSKELKDSEAFPSHQDRPCRPPPLNFHFDY